MTLTQTDLRPALAQGQQWVETLIAAVDAEQLGLPTPCPDLDVRQLIQHLIAGATRVRVMAEGGDATTVPFLLDEVPDADLAGRYPEVAAAGRHAWQQHDDLTVMVRAPWGEVPAAAAIGGYLTEVVTHGWDLAVATGQPAEADPELAATAEAAARRGIPADRGPGVPFGPVVEPAPDATPTERLVNWLGRQTVRTSS